MIKAVPLFQLQVSQTRIAELIRMIPMILNRGQFELIVTLNPIIYERCQSEPKLKHYLESSLLIVPDGSGVCWALKYLNNKKVMRCPGVELVDALFKLQKYSVYLVGGKQFTISLLKEKLKRNYPDLMIKGACNGYFNESEKQQIIDDILHKKPDIILVGMGLPKQELFLMELKSVLSYGIGIGVGGSFDVLSGEIKRAPTWVQILNLEWLYRSIIQPARITNWVLLFQFIRRVIMYKWLR